MKNTKKFLFLLLAVICLICLTTGCKGSQGSTSIVTNTPTPIITPFPTLESTTEPTKQPTPENTSTPEPTLEPTSETTPEPTPEPTPASTPKPTAKPTAAPTAKPTQKPSGSTVVQRANPDTGISWDGKSAIVYTYTDGTTGTVPKPGATYEQLPGRFNTIPQNNTPSVYDGTCSKCGKKEGDGTNGTCVQWLMKDVDCPHCGAHVPVRTCHTCSE